jgi:hypothetical protein
MNILLTPLEVRIATHVGRSRQSRAEKAGFTDRHGIAPEDAEWSHILGAAGEMAVAKALDVYWLPTMESFKAAGDLGEYEIRTRSRDNYDLIIRPDDPSRVFILVTGSMPRFWVRGWIDAEDAKAMPDCWKAYGGRPAAWFVPADRLWPIQFLLDRNELREHHG